MLLTARPGLKASLLFSLCSILVGCKSYEPLPLDETPRLIADPAALVRTVPAGWPGAGAVALDPAAPLDAIGFAVLVLENNPDLKSGRADRGIAEAQVLQAGLLPNPQLSGNYGTLLGGPARFDSWTAGFSEDIKSLITLSAQRGAARFEARKVDADLLWQEWQAVGKARLLFVDTVEQQKLHRLLLENRALFAARAERSGHALAAGDIDLMTATPDLTALGDLDKQIADLDRQILSRQHDIDALLGLSPDVRLRFVDRIDLPPVDPAAIESALSTLPQRRPDLAALQLGYGAQEEKVRGAILAQFPALTFGGTGGSDTSHVLTFGPQITFDLPIFNRNQGNIAIERATRQKLHDEYRNRMNASVGEVTAMLREQALLQRQSAEVRTALVQATSIAERADRAYRVGNIDERTYVDLQMVRLSKQQELVALEQQMLQQQVAMATLTGTGMPPITLSTPDQPSPDPQTAGAE
ncbi:MAG: TolC family protein [Rhodospirillales bacterium]|nr:TolC family protein [Rhodospirillales bacterium]